MIMKSIRKVVCLNPQPKSYSVIRLLSTQLNNSASMEKNLESDNSEVLIKDVGDKGVIVLNRPKALNALNLSMVRKIYPVLKEWETTKKLVIVKGTGEKAFCAGGDVKSLVVALQKPDGPQLGQDFFRYEYTLNHLIGTYKKPYIALIGGITMGGGVGLSVHGKYRIATENTLFAMPETAIGLFPDVGGTHFLPRLNGKLGLYLGLTGHRLKGADVVLSGIATHYVPAQKLNSVTEELLSSESNDIDNILKPYHADAVKQEFSLAPRMKEINECFSAPTVEEIINRLKAKKSEWSEKMVNTLSTMSPTALKVTKKALDEGSKKSLEDCLKMEYRLANACLNKDSDFAEGVRALLIDKDQKPVWNPKSLEEVTDEYIAKRFAMLPSQRELMLSKLS